MSRDGQSLTFKYDHNGMRIQKVLEHSWYPGTTNYTYHGKLLTHMEVAYTDFDEVGHVDKLHFFYDAQSRPVKVRFNGTIYTYVHNLQGDVVGILDSNGALVVEYKYDAWGKPLATTGSLADTLGIRNPFRYRGYIYDEESGLYYLRSRYYVSWRCVFLNADSILGIRGGILSHNAYGYCGGNPVMQEDPDGLFGNGSVHSWVCEDIVARSGGTIMRKDYQLVSLESGGYGLLDLVDPSTGEIWEVKRVSVSVSAAIRQFSAYLRGTPNEKIKAEKYIAGDYDRIPPRAFICEGYLVVYGALENGIVLYDYIDLKKVCYVSLVVLLAKLTNTAAKYAARAGAKAALGGASISLCGAGIPGGVPNVGPMVQDFRVGSYNAWMSSFAFKY